MTKRTWLTACVSTVVALFATQLVVAQAAPPVGAPLLCSVEGAGRELRPALLCKRFARELGRAVVLEDGAERKGHGDAIQVIGSDVAWFVVWLQHDEIAAWTRISKETALGREAELLAKAARVVSAAGPKRQPTCASRAVRARSEVAFPWDDLSSCRRFLPEIVDPWSRGD